MSKFLSSARLRLCLLWLVNVAAALAATLPLPAPLRLALASYAVSVGGGLLVATAAGVRVRSVTGLVLVPSASWAAALAATVLPGLLGLRLTTTSVVVGLAVAEALVVIAGLTPALGRLRGVAPEPAPGSDPRPVAWRWLTTLVLVAAVAGALAVAGGHQRPLDGLPATQFALDAELARDPEIDAAAGGQVRIPVTVTTTGNAPLPTRVAVSVDGQPAPDGELRATGTGRADGVVVVTAPARAGRHKIVLSVVNPTFVDATPPADPATATGPIAEAQGSARTLTLAVWVVVR